MQDQPLRDEKTDKIMAEYREWEKQYLDRVRRDPAEFAADGSLMGRRIPLTPEGNYGKLEKAGDYSGPVAGYTGDAPAVFFLLPIAGQEGKASNQHHLHHVCSPPHSFTEEPDGTLTIAGSILSYIESGKPGWHGHLQQGRWVPCADSR